MKSSAPTQGAALHSHHPPAMPAVPDPAARLSAAARKDIGKARCGTPQSAEAALPACGARIALRVLKHTCVLRPLRCREAAKTGAVSEGRSYAFYRRTGDNERSDGRLPYEKQLFRRRRRSTLQPLAGEPFRRQSPKSLPCKGRWMRRKAQPEGCIAALRRRCPAKPGRALPCVPQGAISVLRAGTSYFALRNAACGRQCLHRPGSHAAGSGRRYTTGSPHQAQRRADEIIGPCAGGSTPQPSSTRHACRPRSRRPFALHCRAGVHARREGLRRRPPFLQKILEKTGAGCKIPAGPFVV